MIPQDDITLIPSTPLSQAEFNEGLLLGEDSSLPEGEIGIKEISRPDLSSLTGKDIQDWIQRGEAIVSLTSVDPLVQDLRRAFINNPSDTFLPMVAKYFDAGIIKGHNYMVVDTEDDLKNSFVDNGFATFHHSDAQRNTFFVAKADSDGSFEVYVVKTFSSYHDHEDLTRYFSVNWYGANIPQDFVAKRPVYLYETITGGYGTAAQNSAMIAAFKNAFMGDTAPDNVDLGDWSDFFHDSHGYSFLMNGECDIGKFTRSIMEDLQHPSVQRVEVDSRERFIRFSGNNCVLRLACVESTSFPADQVRSAHYRQESNPSSYATTIRFSVFADNKLTHLAMYRAIGDALKARIECEVARHDHASKVYYEAKESALENNQGSVNFSNETHALAAELAAEEVKPKLSSITAAHMETLSDTFASSEFIRRVVGDMEELKAVRSKMNRPWWKIWG